MRLLIFVWNINLKGFDDVGKFIYNLIRNLTYNKIDKSYIYLNLGDDDDYFRNNVSRTKLRHSMSLCLF